MKKTQNEIMKALQDNQSLEYDNGKLLYWIHVNGTNLVNDINKAEISFSSIFNYDVKDNSYDWENENNQEFMNCVEDLTNQVNNFLN